MVSGSGFSGSNFFFGVVSVDFGSVASVASADVAVVAADSAVVSGMLVPLSALRSGVLIRAAKEKAPLGGGAFSVFTLYL
jgi:hypothetical protein